MSSLVSVVVPVFNRQTLVRRALDSILSQTYRAIEVVVVDDGSSDHTAQVVGECAKRDGRVRLVRHDCNRGAPAARNTGISASEGSYVAFVDSDDEWLPPKLAKQMEVFQRGPEAIGVVHCGYRKQYEDGRPSEDFCFDLSGEVHAAILGNYGLQTSTLLVKRDCFTIIGGFDERLRSCQDWDMCIRLAKHWLFDYVPEVLSIYHMHGGPTISDNLMCRVKAHLRVRDRCRVRRGSSSLASRACPATFSYTWASQS
jgi:glycosyltransferase involved in cell wall biosynthesis